MTRIIKQMESKYLLPSLHLIEDVFTQWRDAAEGKTVRRLVEEIRAKQSYIPELELIMVDENDDVIGYAMFSAFSIEGKYENELLILTPVAVKTPLQRQHISKDLIEHGFAKAKELGFSAVLVEGDPKNYTARGFRPSYLFGIKAGPNVALPHPDCLMIKQLNAGRPLLMSGLVDFSCYEALRGE